MKNKSVLTVTLYVFTILSLGYTTYYLFSSYAQISSYYASYNVGAGTIAMTLLSSCFAPLSTTVILYGLAGISDMMYQILHPKKEELVEEKKEEVQPEQKEAEGE
ncbi:MAG: EscU/YscU/HrcU family type III secretion system export apparatus switch protein [Firmicutes bacterium]|nr:EscU/YscU/HrcU family type III secretion system export apparatus switch protein [Bacillota bacterium]